METIRWGIIGCGDVTEVKSGPAFYKVPGSALVAVMRRDEDKVKDYARRHKVSKWYTDAGQLIADPEVNAVYIATPPSSHLEYALAAIEAGKPVYLEKPMTLNAGEAKKIKDACNTNHVKLTVAHYRRAQPRFRKLRELINEKAIGDIRYVQLEFNKQRMNETDLQKSGNAWRVDPKVAGGGLFNDLAPHQLDIIYYLFGDAEKISAIAAKQGGVYNASDMISAAILLNDQIVFNGTWCFSAAATLEKDECRIVGDKGSIRFSFFAQQPLVLEIKGQVQEFSFESLQHVQQPMIEEVVRYFGGQGGNPCSAEEGYAVMKWIDRINGN